jgi:hypothetical protein
MSGFGQKAKCSQRGYVCCFDPNNGPHPRRIYRAHRHLKPSNFFRSIGAGRPSSSLISSSVVTADFGTSGIGTLCRASPNTASVSAMCRDQDLQRIP